MKSLSWWALAAFGLSLVGSQACYDHSYTQAIKSQRKAAEAAKGAEVTAGGGLSRPIEYEGRVRVYATREYRENRSGWARRIEDLVDSTARVLGPAFAVRLEVVDTFGWEASCNQDRLAECLQELIAHDSGDDVDWVVALVGAQPRFTTSFEELGMAMTPSKHFVLRDLYDAGERQQINEAFSTMTQAKRNEIYKARQSHKQLVVFLHEWAHTLGALHVRSDVFILHPAYDDEMAFFSEANLGLVEASLEDRFPPEANYPHLQAFIDANDSEEWLPGERDQLAATFGGVARTAGVSPRPETRHAFVVPGATNQLLPEATAQDRARYDQAISQVNANDYEAAWESLSPLLRTYPNCYAIQHFGCGLAMQVGAREEAGRACRRSIELVGPASNPDS
ncbi:MAG: hypothetical protein WBG86_00885 [Polyangiales bacterium]